MSQNPRWLTVSITLISQSKQFITLVWVFGLWQLIMLTVKCHGYKIHPGLFSKLFAVEDDEMSQIGISITMRCLPQQGSPQQKIKRWYCSMLKPDFMNTLNQENESPRIKRPCLPAPFPSDTRNSKFYIQFILMYYQKTSILQSKVAKSIKKKIPTDYKVVPPKMVPEILRWCWKVKKMVLCHSKTGHGELCSKYISSKLTQTITLVRKRWYSEYKMDKNICQWNLFVIPIWNNIFHHILQSCDHNCPLPGAGIIKMTLGVMYGQKFIINIAFCH